MWNERFRLCIFAGICAACLLVSAPDIEAQALRQLTDYKTDAFSGRSIDSSGTLVVAASSADLVGSNPEHAWQIFKWELPGGTCSQVTSFAEGVGGAVSLSDGDHWIAFTSPSDPLGNNSDHSYELFMMQLDGSGLAQLTDNSVMGGGEVTGYYLEISGTANMILFKATLDPLGTNPDHLEQLFIIDTATLVITQLTHASINRLDEFSISDDGLRIVFGHADDLTGGNPDGGWEIFKIDADGQNLTQITSGSEYEYSTDPMISGNGQVIVYKSSQIYMALWNSPTPIALTTGYDPSITYDGMWIYYVDDGASYPSQIYKIPRTGGTPIQLTAPPNWILNSDPVVSGSGTYVMFISQSGEYPGGNNPDGGPELMAMRMDGGLIQQLTLIDLDGWAGEPDISADGTRIAYHWGVYGPYDIYSVNADGSDSIQLTTFGTNWYPAITGDGETIVFGSYADLTGEGACPDRNIYQIQSGGTGLLLLTDPDPCGISIEPAVASNGSKVVFQSYGIFDGVGTGELEIFSMPVGGGPVTQISNDGATQNARKNPRVSADGEWAVWHLWDFSTSTVLPGALLRGRTDGSVVETLGFASLRPDISGDGQLVVFHDRSDYLGTNTDLNQEIYLYDTLAESVQQLTLTSGGDCFDPRISDDGEIVYFLSTSEIFGWEPGNLYRVHVASGVVERAGGPCNGNIFGDYVRMSVDLSVDADGSRAVFASPCNLTGDNLDRNREVWLVDFNPTSTLNPSTTAPTVVEWAADPRYVRYDLIRGDVANLQAGAGGTVDLGTVICIEDDSVDTNTLGNEDVAQPASGQVFFYLHRGTQGILDGPGSYGQGTGGAERIAASGDCTP